MVGPQASNAEPFSGLEVVPAERASQPSPQYFHGSRDQTQTEQDAAQKQTVVDVNDGLESPYSVPKETVHATYLPTEHETLPALQADGQNAGRKRRKRIIWLAIIAVIVLGAIAGGVAGGLASKHSKTKTQSGTSSG